MDMRQKRSISKSVDLPDAAVCGHLHFTRILCELRMTMTKSCSDRRADLADKMESSPSRIPSRLLGLPSASRVVVPLAFVTYMTGGSRESVLPLQVMFASVQRHHAPHSCAVLLTDNEATIGCEGCTPLSQRLHVLRYQLPYSDDATEKIPGRRVGKHVCNNRLATEASFITEAAAGKHICSGAHRFHIALIDSDVLVVGSLAPLFMEHQFSVAFTLRQHPTMPINNGLRLIGGHSAQTMQLAARFYSHLVAMVHLMVATSKVEAYAERFMSGPVFWFEQKATALLIGKSGPRGRNASLTPFRRIPHATLLPPDAVLLLPAANFNHGLHDSVSRTNHPCLNPRLQPDCGVSAIHFKSTTKCLLLTAECMALAGLTKEEAVRLEKRARAMCAPADTLNTFRNRSTRRTRRGWWSR